MRSMRLAFLTVSSDAGAVAVAGKCCRGTLAGCLDYNQILPISLSKQACQLDNRRGSVYEQMRINECAALGGEDVGAADHMLCKHLMQDAARPIEEALRFSRVAGHTKGHHEAAMLKDEAYLYTCICTATQARCWPCRAPPFSIYSEGY